MICTKEGKLCLTAPVNPKIPRLQKHRMELAVACSCVLIIGSRMLVTGFIAHKGASTHNEGGFPTFPLIVSGQGDKHFSLPAVDMLTLY